jgi:Fe2+ or Zn2+ uptake regulation protein/voltage-gated potassium channel Kch
MAVFQLKWPYQRMMWPYMNLRDRKMAVLRLLGEEAEPIGLPDLLYKLGEHVKERSVRRWLQLLVEEGVVQKIGRKRGTKYLVAKGSDRHTIAFSDAERRNISSCFSSESQGVIEQVSKPLFEREPVTYRPEWLDSYIPNQTFYLSQPLREQLHNAGMRVSSRESAGTYAHQIFNRLLIDLSYNSSRLEGNTYSLLETEQLLLSGKKAAGKLDQEEIMILNHKEAIRYLVDNAARLEVNRNVICTLHYLLADGLLDAKYAGKMRDYAVRIGGSVYMPFEDQRHLELQLEILASKGARILDPFEQGLFLLAHLSYLQAFADVNKRTARLSANIPFIKNNLVPLAFRDIIVSDYMSAMIALYELRQIGPLADLYVYSYLRTCAAYDETVKAIGYDEVRVRYRQQRRALLRLIISGKSVGKAMEHLIAQKADEIADPRDRQLFVEDTFEDLAGIDESRLVGLGVTPDELKAWQMLHQTP